jgi:hypothetical protein
LQEFYNNTEVFGGRTIAAVEPVERLAMFLSNATRHPNDYACLQAGGIRYELPKMGMISLFKLVLYYNTLVAAQVSGQYVNGEIAYRLLSTLNLKIKSEHLPN